MMLESKEHEVRSGLTWRSFLIMLFIIFIVTPVNIWADISIGAGGISSLAILIIAAELARFLGAPLTLQEIATILVGIGGLNYAYGLSQIEAAYFSQNSLLHIFGIKYIPYWVAPLPESGFYQSRSLWHPVVRGIWLRLDNLLLPSMTALAGLSLGILNKILYVDQENLPYPGVQVNASLCMSIAEREESRFFVFSVSFIVALIYGIFMYIIPQVFNIRIIPSLWFDLSPSIQAILPGACFGIATNLPALLPGLYLPPVVIFSQLIGSIAIWVFGNWYIVTNGITEFSKIYTPAMPIYYIYIFAYQYVWMMPLIGLGLFTGLSTLRPSAVRKAFSTLMKAAKVEKFGVERLFSIWIVVIPFALIVVSSLLTIWFWAPDYPFFPWLPAAYSIIISLAQSLLIGRAAGTGVSISIPANMDKLILVAVNYEGTNAWFISPAVVSPSFGGEVSSNFKLSQLTRTSFSDFLIMFFITSPISIAFSIIFTQMFWSIAPIPSTVYPWSAIEWPRNVMYRAIWITRPRGIFRLDWMIYGALVGGGLHTLLYTLHLPAYTIMISLLSGMGTLPPMVMGSIIGYIIRLILERLLRKETYEKFRYIIVAGISAGTGLAVTVGIGCFLIIRNISLWYY
ncbi:MAG: hypothetical protein QXN40_08005 [Candidatus Bathyarchaeia archaeon]